MKQTSSSQKMYALGHSGKELERRSRQASGCRMRLLSNPPDKRNGMLTTVGVRLWPSFLDPWRISFKSLRSRLRLIVSFKPWQHRKDWPAGGRKLRRVNPKKAPNTTSSLVRNIIGAAR